MVQISGVITNVFTSAAKSELTGTHAIGSVTLSVYDAYPFEATGGTVEINGLEYVYTSVNYETNQIILFSGLTVAGAEGDEVLVVPYGSTKRAMVNLDDGDEGVQAIVPFTMKDRLYDGVRDDPDQESVVLSDDRGMWEVYAIDDEIAVIQGTAFITGTPGAGLPYLELTDDQSQFSFIRFHGDGTEDTFGHIAAGSSSLGAYLEMGCGSPLSTSFISQITMSTDPVPGGPNDYITLVTAGEIGLSGQVYYTTPFPSSDRTRALSQTLNNGVISTIGWTDIATLEREISYAAGNFTVQRVGMYQIMASIEWGLFNQTGRREIKIYINGNAMKSEGCGASEIPGAHTTSIHGMFRLAAGDVISIRAFQNGGDNNEFIVGCGIPVASGTRDTSVQIQYIGR